MIPCNCKLISFFSKSYNKLSKDFIQSLRLNLTLGLSYLQSFRSSLQSHPLWVTLYHIFVNVQSWKLLCWINEYPICNPKRLISISTMALLIRSFKVRLRYQIKIKLICRLTKDRALLSWGTFFSFNSFIKNKVNGLRDVSNKRIRGSVRKKWKGV